jgi:hypothetical protein
MYKTALYCAKKSPQSFGLQAFRYFGVKFSGEGEICNLTLKSLFPLYIGLFEN